MGNTPTVENNTSGDPIVPPPPVPPPPCTCPDPCESQPSGTLFYCEDGVMTPILAPLVRAYLVYDPDVPGYLWEPLIGSNKKPTP